MTQQYPPAPPPQPPYGPDARQWQDYGHTPPPPVPPKKTRKWPWIVGGLFVLVFVLPALGGNTQATPAPAPAAAAPAGDTSGGSTVVYEVTGKGSASVTYMKEGFSQEQQTSAKLPFKKELQFKDKVGSFAPLSLVAQHSAGGGDITCRITVDGQVVGESTSSGPYAVVTCNGNG